MSIQCRSPRRKQSRGQRVVDGDRSACRAIWTQVGYTDVVTGSQAPHEVAGVRFDYVTSGVHSAFDCVPEVCEIVALVTLGTGCSGRRTVSNARIECFSARPAAEADACRRTRNQNYSPATAAAGP